MVFEIKVPTSIKTGMASGQILSELTAISPKFIAYALSFLLVAIFWVNHHSFFYSLARTSRALLWHNNHLLFWLSLIPFPTALLGEFPFETVTVMLYGLIVLGAAVAFNLMAFHADHANLYDQKISKKYIRKLNRKSLYGPVLYLTAVLLAPLSVYISLGIYILIPVIYFLPARIIEAIDSE